MNIKCNNPLYQSTDLRNFLSVPNVYFTVAASVAIDCSSLLHIILGSKSSITLVLRICFPKLVIKNQHMQFSTLFWLKGSSTLPAA